MSSATLHNTQHSGTRRSKLQARRSSLGRQALATAGSAFLGEARCTADCPHPQTLQGLGIELYAAPGPVAERRAEPYPDGSVPQLRDSASTVRPPWLSSSSLSLMRHISSPVVGAAKSLTAVEPEPLPAQRLLTETGVLSPTLQIKEA